MSIEQVVNTYEAKRSESLFFDLNCWYDAFPEEMLKPAGGLDALVSMMKKKDIRKAVVTNAITTHYDPYYANDELEKLIAPHDNLYGCMVLTSDLSFCSCKMYDYIKKKLENKFVAVRMFPKYYAHGISETACGEIFELMEKIRLPLILWHDEAGFDEIEGVAAMHPGIPVIIEGNRSKLLYHNRRYMSLLAKYSNIYIESHALILFDELEFLVKKFGSNRILFGTYSPYNIPDVSISNICLSGLGDREIADIAHRNLENIINEIQI